MALIRYHWDADPTQEQAGATLALQAPSGDHTLTYQPVDAAGHVGAESAITTKYDDSTVSVGIVLAGTDLGGGLYAGAVQATITADGGTSGIDTAEYQLNSGPATPFTSPKVVDVTVWGSNQIDAQIVSVSGQPANAQATFDIDAGPSIVSQDPDGHTNQPVSSVKLETSEPVVGADARDASNYSLLHLGSDRAPSGGDGTLDDLNEIDVSDRITGINWVPATGGDGAATLTIDPPLEDEAYRLTINGTTSIQDLAGNMLLGGDHVEELTLETGPATVALDLDATSDSGMSTEDHLTNQTELLFNVTINKPGRIGIDFDGDGGEDAAQLVSAAGTYQFTSPALADGLHNAGVTFDPAVGAQTTDALGVTIDTAGPLGLAGAPTELGPLFERQIAFDEDIDPATLEASDIIFTGPGGVDLGQVSGITGSGAAFTITFPSQTAAGAYSLLIGPDVRDLAGNMLNQNDNDTNGEPGLDEFDDTFDLVPDTFGPAVTGHQPTGLVAPGVDSVRLTFDEWIADTSFTGDDVAMATPGGNVDSALITIAPVADPGNPGLFNTFDVQFPPQTADGAYTLAISPGVTHLTGNATHQFGIDTQPPASTLAVSPAIPNGSEWGWYSSVPRITISASDAGAGVREVHHKWDDGADAAGSDLWYRRQGRILRRLTDLLHRRQRTTARHLDQLGQFMRAEFPGGLTKADALATQQRVADTGFTPTELERLLEIITPEVVDDFRQWFADQDFSDLPDDLIAGVEEASVGLVDLAAQLSDHKVYNPDAQNVMRAYLAAGFNLGWPAGTYKPHNVDVLINGNLSAKLTDTVPQGTYLWEADPSFLIYADRGVASNSIDFNTTHLNGGHYVVNEQVELILQLSQIAVARPPLQWNRSLSGPSTSRGAPWQKGT